jgi:LPXTG-site transpeptidase (sortase) family protein
MTTKTYTPQKPTYLMPTSIPIQIWPDPEPIKETQIILKPEVRRETKTRTKNKKYFNTQPLQTLFKNLNTAAIQNIRAYYSFIVIFLITVLIAASSYYSFSVFIQPYKLSAGVPLTSIAKLYQNVLTSYPKLDTPARLQIPAINVDAAIVPVGVTTKGTLDVPPNLLEVGWYKFGPKPGQAGSAVIDAHFDGPNGEPGVFNRLDSLKVGQEIIVQNDKNIPTYFVIKKLTNYLFNDSVPEVYNTNDGTHLNLITCNGVWDENTKNYSQRLIVFADAIQK